MQFKPSQTRKAKYKLDKFLVYERSFLAPKERDKHLIEEAPKKKGILKRLLGWMFGKK
jgi:hypothetical protein